MSTDKPAIGERKPKARVGSDYAAITSFALGTVAAVLVVAGVLASWSQFSLAGLLWLMIAPALLLITPVGFLLALVAIVRRVDMKWGAVGIALNLTPIVVFLLPGPAPPTYTLTSGKQIKIMSVIGPVYFPKGPPALIMECETETSIDDLLNLRKEVDEIWAHFKHDVERAGMSQGIIRMIHNDVRGWVINRGKGYGFVFEKRSDGQWHCLYDDKLNDDKDRAGRAKG
jgi:hypothetical protein